jgi:endonuclease YncB( thermonuclease family)
MICRLFQSLCSNKSTDVLSEYTSIEYNDTIQFIPPISCGKVIKVYDGDTFTIASMLPYTNSPMYRFSVRLNGIDCPEIRSKNDEEQIYANLAKDELNTLIMGRVVELKNVKLEKYGRILADAYVNNVHINKHMIDVHLAIPYNGGTKCIKIEWKEYHQSGNYI